ncbi:hypothetical protein DSO57_1003650 [Entomophthora muscae]|uniref:Uncharacterized protein n=1 Tax=Entomophthora muscae TaxID=34485 RepID=A0ACC2SLC1_9FUNG|nr:hypothetical protein DSO57_1003650 [Entomophthora muscae]
MSGISHSTCKTDDSIFNKLYIKSMYITLIRTVQVGMLNKIPKRLLDSVLDNLVFEEQLVARRVCREWKDVLEPKLTQINIYRAKDRETRRFGKFVKECFSKGNLDDLYLFKSFFVGADAMILDFHSDWDPSPLEKQLFSHLSDRGVKFKLEIDRDYKQFKNIFNFTCITLNFVHRNIIEFLEHVHQPQLKELQLQFRVDTDNVMALITELIEGKFPQLTFLNLRVEVYADLLLSVFPSNLALETMILDIYTEQDGINSAILPANPCFKCLKLTQETFRIIKNSPIPILLESVKEAHLCITYMLYFELEVLFPNLEYLHCQEELLYPGDYELPEAFLPEPQRVTRLDLDFNNGNNLTLDFDQQWPTVRTCALKCPSMTSSKVALRWIFSCLPCLDSLILDIPDLEYPHLKFLGRILYRPLTKLYSRASLPLEFIEAIRIRAPNLTFIMSPLSVETQTALQEIPGLYFEALPGFKRKHERNQGRYFNELGISKINIP